MTPDKSPMTSVLALALKLLSLSETFWMFYLLKHFSVISLISILHILFTCFCTSASLKAILTDFSHVAQNRNENSIIPKEFTYYRFWKSFKRYKQNFLIIKFERKAKNPYLNLTNWNWKYTCSMSAFCPTSEIFTTTNRSYDFYFVMHSAVKSQILLR